MKILVFSDSHGSTSYMEQVVRAEQPDQILHLGDVIRDARRLSEAFPDIPLDYVPGNCDGFSGPEAERVITLEGHKILMMHGHTRGVKHGLGRAVLAAQEAGAEILLFGHTHNPLCDRAGPLWILNPGSIHGTMLTTCGMITMEQDAVTCRTVQVETRWS